MLKITSEAASALKVAKTTTGAPENAGIRIWRAENPPDRTGRTVAVALAFAEEPEPGDEEFEENGLRIFLEDALLQPLDGRILDVSEANEGAGFVFR